MMYMRRNSLLPKPQRVDLTKIAIEFSSALEEAEKKAESRSSQSAPRAISRSLDLSRI